MSRDEPSVPPSGDSVAGVGVIQRLRGFLDGSAREIVDPPEPWEVPVARHEAARIGDRGLAGHPYRPSRREDVPEGATEALARVCGPLSLTSLFVVPRTSRWIDEFGRRSFVTPTEVLGFGESALAMWIDDGGEGFVRSIPLERLAAIDDRHILLYGRLALVAADDRLVVRYNTVARPELLQNLLDVRRRAATTNFSTGSSLVWPDGRQEGVTEASRRRLPYKWANLLASTDVRIDPAAPATVAVGWFAEAKRWRSAPAAGIAVLSPRELVVAVEPGGDEAQMRYGFELLSVSRERLRSLSFDGRILTVRAVVGNADSGQTSVSRPLSAHLAAAMRQAFGEAVVWE
jgi:hypothetical protein